MDDHRRALAEALYAEALSLARRGEKVDSAVNAALYWIGYRQWMLPNNGFTPPDTLRRRNQLFDRLRDRPYAAMLQSTINSLGWSRPPDRKAEVRFQRLDRRIDIVTGEIRWGLAETLERDLIFHMRYDIVRLAIIDDGRTLHEITYRPEEDGWEYAEPMSALGLTDNDYRLQFECLHSAGGSRVREIFDFALLGGEWRRLEYQGGDWDGEFAGADAIQAPADSREGPVVTDDTVAWIARQTRRYGDSKRSGKHWRELEKLTA